MKKSLFVLWCLMVYAATSVAAVYEWTDANGVTNFTDDPEKIPKAYRKKAVRREVEEKGTTIPAPPRHAAPTPPSRKASPLGDRYGGKTGNWWQDRFHLLQGEIKSVNERLESEQAQLVELRRKRVIFMRARDREAVNRKQAEIDADTARLGELQRKLDELKGEADTAGVPDTFRR